MDSLLWMLGDCDGGAVGGSQVRSDGIGCTLDLLEVTSRR
jgi:hypothetical protein